MICFPISISSQSLDFPYEQWYHAALDLIDCRTYKIPATRPRRPPLSKVLHLNFLSKNIEKINLSAILRDKDVISSIPSIAKSFKPPTIVYSLNPPIGSKLFNFNKFVNNLDVESFLVDSSTLPCKCSKSPFKDKDHGHIITGDLRMIQNNKLRKLFTKGRKN